MCNIKRTEHMKHRKTYTHITEIGRIPYDSVTVYKRPAKNLIESKTDPSMWYRTESKFSREMERCRYAQTDSLVERCLTL